MHKIINNQNDTIAQLQEQLVNGLLDEDGKTTAKDLIAKIESHEITLQNQEERLGELKAFVEKETEDESEIKFKAYTVQPGDTLTKICNSAGIDYSADSRIILSINGIENANQIFVGQIILLPVKKNNIENGNLVDQVPVITCECLVTIMTSPCIDLLAAVRASTVDYKLNASAVSAVSTELMAGLAIPDRIGVNVVFRAFTRRVATLSPIPT